MKLSEALFPPVREHRSRSPTIRSNSAVVATGPLYGVPGGTPSRDAAQKLSAVYASVEIRSDDMSCLPNYVLNTHTRERVANHPILFLLNIRPNPVMAPQVRRKLLERSILYTGAAYDWIIRDPLTREPAELIPLVGNLVQVKMDRNGRCWYYITNPITKEVFWVPQEDICHYKGPSDDGINGQSVLSHASQTIQAGLAAQDYNKSFYESGGQPSGILTVEGDFSGYVHDDRWQENVMFLL